MSKDDWFRRSTWTEQDQLEFNLRLQRSRGSFYKAQYLRIQGLHLLEAGNYLAAIELFDRVINEFPEKSELTGSYQGKATAFESLGQFSEAIEQYRNGVEAQRNYPGHKTGIEVNFAWFVVVNQLTDLYEEALIVIKDLHKDPGFVFPITTYKYSTIQALIANHQGRYDTAQRYARIALGDAGKKHSGSRNHAELGWVGTQDSEIERMLIRIVNNLTQ